MKRLPILTLMLAALAFALHAVPALTHALQFERTALARFELWRLVAAHFTHFGADHLRWDVAAFIAFGSVVEFRSRSSLVSCVVISAVVISVAVLGLQPQFNVYRGLSGIASALFAFVSMDLLREGWHTREKLVIAIGSAALVGFLAKCTYELATNRALFVGASDAFQPVPLAHLLGAVIGALIAFRQKATPAAGSRASADFSENLLKQ